MIQSQRVLGSSRTCLTNHPRTRPSLRLALAITVASLTAFASQSAYAESWTDLSGTRTIEARMVGLWNNTLVLQLTDGRRISVKMDDLEAASRIQAQNMARDQTRIRGDLVGELTGQAEEAAAPAPDPLPKPPAAANYLPPSPDANAAAQLEWRDGQFKAGHFLRASFDSLPSSYQSDMDRLAKLAATKVDTETLNNIIGSLHQAGDVIVTRQSWMFSHPRIALLSSSSQDTVQSFLLTAGGMLRDGFDPEAFNLEQLQSIPLKDFIAQRNDAIAPYFAKMAEIAPSSAFTSYELVSEKEGVAMVKQISGDSSTTASYTKVDQTWVPTDLAETWADEIANHTKELNDASDGTWLPNQNMSWLPTMIKPHTGPMMQATSRKDFHVAMEPVFELAQPIASAASMLAGMDIGGRGGRGGNNGGGIRGSSYGSQGDTAYEEEMEEEEMEEEMDAQYGPGRGTDYESQIRQGQRPGRTGPADDAQN